MLRVSHYLLGFFILAGVWFLGWSWLYLWWILGVQWLVYVCKSSKAVPTGKSGYLSGSKLEGKIQMQLHYTVTFKTYICRNWAELYCPHKKNLHSTYFVHRNVVGHWPCASRKHWRLGGRRARVWPGQPTSVPTNHLLQTGRCRGRCRLSCPDTPEGKCGGSASKGRALPWLTLFLSCSAAYRHPTGIRRLCPDRMSPSWLSEPPKPRHNSTSDRKCAQLNKFRSTITEASLC